MTCIKKEKSVVKKGKYAYFPDIAGSCDCFISHHINKPPFAMTNCHKFGFFSPWFFFLHLEPEIQSTIQTSIRTLGKVAFMQLTGLGDI